MVLEVSLDLGIYIYIVYSYRTLYLIILINSLLFSAHLLTMILRFLTQLFSTQWRGCLPLPVKTMIYLKLSVILTLARPMVLMILSVRMVKLCDDSLVKPLSTIFQNCIKSGVFSDSWKNQTLSQFIRKITSNK